MLCNCGMFAIGRCKKCEAYLCKDCGIQFYSTFLCYRDLESARTDKQASDKEEAARFLKYFVPECERTLRALPEVLTHFLNVVKMAGLTPNPLPGSEGVWSGKCKQAGWKLSVEDRETRAGIEWVREVWVTTDGSLYERTVDFASRNGWKLTRISPTQLQATNKQVLTTLNSLLQGNVNWPADTLKKYPLLQDWKENMNKAYDAERRIGHPTF